MTGDRDTDLIVVTGPPGAGKTSVSTLLSGLFDPSARVPGDSFFELIDQGYLAPWTIAARRQNETVTAAAAAAAGRLAAGGYTVIYDGVVDPGWVDAFGRAADLTRLHYAVLLPPEHVCLSRVETRTGHGFTDADAARDMYRQFADAHLDARHVVTDLEAPPALAARLQQLVHHDTLIWNIDHPDGR